MAGVLPGLGSGMVRGLYAGPATRAGFGPARNLNEWPPGLARRGPRPGEVGKAHGADRPRLRASTLANSRQTPRRRPGTRRAGAAGFSSLPAQRCAVSARPGRWPARGGGAESGPGGRPCRARPASAGRLDAARADRLHVLFELALRTGLRKGELLGLRWEDLDLDAGTAAIRRTLQRTTTGGLATLPTKTRAAERRIALPTRCIHSLKHHHEQQQRERATAGAAWQHSGHVFTTAQGRPIDPTNLTRTFTTLLRMAGLRRIRFHDLRHSTATLLLEQGVELVVIKELLGHAHIGVTATVYAHVRLRLQRNAIDALGTALTGPEATGTVDGDEPPPCDALVR